jgi:uncharacterized membrane protein YjfL (UPF0719 family)
MYPIQQSSFPAKKEFAVNKLEIALFDCLYSKLTESENGKIKLIRMSNGTLSVEYAGFPIGKVKLQGRKYSMQIIKSLYKSYTVEGDIEQFKEKITEWVEYIRKYLK